MDQRLNGFRWNVGWKKIKWNGTMDLDGWMNG
jgi:hypothetical protein